MRDFRGREREVTALFELLCSKHLVVFTNHRLYHLIIWSIPAGESISAISEEEITFQPLHAKGCCDGSWGRQICHDGYRLCCTICTVEDVRPVVNPSGPEATRQQVILDANPMAAETMH